MFWAIKRACRSWKREHGRLPTTAVLFLSDDGRALLRVECAE
jgi:hypothetical protein